MSYYVIKGPSSHGQYLCNLVNYDKPQWWSERRNAIRFPDEQSAWNWISEAQKRRDDGGAYVARVVRVNTLRDLRAHREILVSEIEGLRIKVRHLERCLEELRNAQPKDASSSSREESGK